MADVTITLDSKPNESLQVGDWVLRTNTTSDSNVASGSVSKFGRVKSISEDSDDVEGVLTPNGDWNILVDKIDTATQLLTTDYLLFSKDSRANNSGLTGYYAEVEMTNSRIDKAELFSVASEISESSK